MSRTARLALLTALGVAFFLVIGLVEWRYILVDSRKGFVERAVKSSELATVQSFPRKFAIVAKKSDKHQLASRGKYLGADHHTWGLSDASSPAIVLFCFNRVGYLNQTLASLAELPGLEEASLYISQDGNHTGVANLVEGVIHSTLGAKAKHVEHWQRERQPLLSEHQVYAVQITCLHTCASQYLFIPSGNRLREYKATFFFLDMHDVQSCSRLSHQT